MLSTTAEYALRIIVQLAQGDGEPQTGKVIAVATKVPAGYASKVLHVLGRAGLVGGRRGRHGGFVLRRDPRRTTLLDVVDAIDPLRRITECPLGREAHRSRLCPLHRTLDGAIATLQASLRSMTVQDVIDDGKGPALCPPKPARLSVSARRGRRSRARPV